MEHLADVKRMDMPPSIRYLSFTNNGKEFITTAASPHAFGRIDFLPVSSQLRRKTPPIRIRDLHPIISIYDLRQLVRRVRDAIFAVHGHDRLRLFDTILLLLAAKIYDEAKNPGDLYLSRLAARADCLDEFIMFCDEALESIGCERFRSRVDLDNASLIACLQTLSDYSIRLTLEIGGQTDVLGTFYQEIVSSTFRGSLGAYFTPKPIAEIAVKIAQPTAEDDILDMCCGSGTFLLEAFSSACHGGTSPRVFGCDIQERMVLAALMNCFLHGASNAKIIQGDALKMQLGDFRFQGDGFSLIVGNPPFAGFESEDYLPYSNTLPGAGTRVNKVVPFIVKTVNLLKPGGRAALVIPSSVLNGEAISYVRLRNWLSEQVDITEIIGLPRDAFVHTDCGIEGALLFFHRKPAFGQRRNEVFFFSLANIGYDRRGRAVNGSEVDHVFSLWKRHNRVDRCWVGMERLRGLSRWDPNWLDAAANRADCYGIGTHVRLTDLCTIANRTMKKSEIQFSTNVRYFEVSDTDMDRGVVLRTHMGNSDELLKKARLRLMVRKGDVLVPNHRDSLVAKTALHSGRSAVIVGEKEDGCITSNRFTILESIIDPRLLKFVLNSPDVRRQMVLQARGSASFDIRDRVLYEIWVHKCILDPSLQQEVLGLFDQMEEAQLRIDALNQHLASLMDS
jgi:methylase of polypeptide subunit release factors